MSEEWIGILSLAILFGAIFIGFPIAFTLIAIALGVGYVALGPIALHLMTIQFFAVMKETSLASVPFFLFMGFVKQVRQLNQIASARDNSGRPSKYGRGLSGLRLRPAC